MIAYERCGRCRELWYFKRGFCPRCGAAVVEQLCSGGDGVVYAISAVHRAPSPEQQVLVPYWIALVDIDEGFRMMAHARGELRIGERVRVQTASIIGVPIPVATRPSSATGARP